MGTAREEPARRAGRGALQLALVISVAAALGLGAGWFGSRRPPPTATDAAVRDELARLRGEVEALKNTRPTSVVAPTPMPAETAASGEKLAQAPAAEVAAPEPSDPAFRQRRERERGDAAQIRMDVELDSQARDRAFEQGVEEQLRAVYANPEFAGTEPQALECRTTLCRVTSTHATREAMEAFTRNAAQYPPFNTEVFYRSGDGDRPTSTLYVARPGSSLPHDF